MAFPKQKKGFSICELLEDIDNAYSDAEMFDKKTNTTYESDMKRITQDINELEAKLSKYEPKVILRAIHHHVRTNCKHIRNTIRSMLAAERSMNARYLISQFSEPDSKFVSKSKFAGLVNLEIELERAHGKLFLECRNKELLAERAQKIDNDIGKRMVSLIAGRSLT